MNDGQPYTVGPGGTTIATVALQHEHDLLALRRRLRDIGGDLHFDDRDIARLSTAAYEAARQMFTPHGATTAEIRATGDAGRAALHVVVRAPAADAADRNDSARKMEAISRMLDALVDRVAVDTSGEAITITLTSFPSGVAAAYAELDDQTERLRQAEDRLRMLLDGVHDYAICMLGPDGEIVSWNAGAERIFGYTADEIVGRNFACFFLATELEEGVPAEHLKTASESGRHEVEGLRVRKGGSAFDASVVLAVLRKASGQVRGFSLVIRDVTERKRLEDDLRRRAEELDAANRAKEDFLATLSHELRTPLNAMLGWTRLLRMGRLDASGVARALETIERNAHIQEQLIADILDVSRIVTGKLRLTLRPVDMTPIIDAAVDAIRPASDAKGVTLDLQITPAGTVMGDPDRLQQVLWNLLSNAIKFTPRGGSVTVSSGRVGANAMIKVTDTGEGMSPELLPYVFDRFRQGDCSATRPHGGLGLGLSIVRHIVELHGGQVQAWSEGLNRGSSFAVQLPVRAVQRAAAARRLDVDVPLTGLKVLVVDDEADAREAVSTVLAQCGARTAAVASARDAMQMIADFQPDVVVSDIAMPGEDGYTLVRKIRAMSSSVATVPVVALTGFTQPEDRRRAMRAGFRHFVPKPVDVDDLVSVVRDVAEPRSGKPS